MIKISKVSQKIVSDLTNLEICKNSKASKLIQKSIMMIKVELREAK